ncbi:MAG TPA: hypothetical protein G4O09_09975, partial [Dehalococcoidia bacterium]|nr:hypothetical protein [Dehalococcoidia bacterium]
SELGPRPRVGTFIASDTVEVGKSIWIFGTTRAPNERVWAEAQFGEEIEVGESIGKEGPQDYAEAGDNLFFHLALGIPKNVVPGEYDVDVYIGEDMETRKLFTTLKINVKPSEE